MVSTNWDSVFSARNGVTLLRSFINGEVGLRSAIRQLESASGRAELYRLERSGVATAKRRIQDALRRRGSR